MTSLLAIVPARAGSKGVPGKNKMPIAGLPLIEYTVAALEASRVVAGIVVTTDDADILARYRDRESVFTVERPAALAQDDSSTVDAVAHALDAWETAGKGAPEAILLAQPTTPLRTVADIDAAYALFLRSGGESVISACLVEGIRHPKDMYRLDGDGKGDLFIPDPEDRTTRHGYERLYQRNGAIYIVSTRYFRRENRLRSLRPVIYEMPWERSIT